MIYHDTPTIYTTLKDSVVPGVACSLGRGVFGRVPWKKRWIGYVVMEIIVICRVAYKAIRLFYRYLHHSTTVSIHFAFCIGIEMEGVMYPSTDSSQEIARPGGFPEFSDLAGYRTYGIETDRCFMAT